VAYTANDHVFLIAARSGAAPVDVTAALNRRGASGKDTSVNVSPDGRFVLLSTERFGCAGWACLAVASRDLRSAAAVRAGGQVVHPEGFSAIASGGRLIVFASGDGPHDRDLWAVRRAGAAWTRPRLLTAASPHAWNALPALSADGRSVAFVCGAVPTTEPGSAICRMSTAGGAVATVLRPAPPPRGGKADAALHQPDFGPDGSIVFKADWTAEQAWRLRPGSRTPTRISRATNDNSPCVLPDGRVATLCSGAAATATASTNCAWPGRPGPAS
jgi:hypothetical protein